MEVVFTQLAARHVDKLHDYIVTKSGVEQADSYIGRIVAFCQRLANFPLRGHQRDDIFPGMRITGFERRVTIAFSVTADSVLIEGIYYGGREYEAELRDEK